MEPLEFRAFHLPTSDPPETELRGYGSHAGRFARLSQDAFRAAVASARRSAAELEPRPIVSVLQRLAAVVDAWQRPGSPWLAEAECVLPEVTGFSQAVTRRGLEALLCPLAGDAVGALLDEELGGREVLDGGIAGRRARGPEVITHVLAGNIPGLGFAPILLSLALRSAVVVKSAAGDPYSAAAFAASVAATDPELGRCIVVHDWRGGDRRFEDTAFDANIVVASGSDAAIAAMHERARCRFLGHGHKVSFAVIDRHMLGGGRATAEAAAALAVDVALWDQHGCLSPQMCVVESGGALGAPDFARLLATAFEGVTRELPPRRLDLDDRAAIASFRAACEWQHSATAILQPAPASSDWTIAIEPGGAFAPTCLNRCLRIVTVEDVAQLPRWLESHRPRLECVGLACAPERRSDISAQLAAAGVHRICRLGTMQAPDLRWKQSGRPRVGDWVEWSTDEGYGGCDGK